MNTTKKDIRMKKLLAICLMGLGLVGCVSPSGDMLNNNFTTILPADETLNGYWSGNNGPYLVTFKFNGDGTGLMCSSYNDKNTLEKLKINNGVMYMQNGLKQTILKNTETDLTLRVNYLGSATFKYTPDANLTNASPYCEKNL